MLLTLGNCKPETMWELLTLVMGGLLISNLSLLLQPRLTSPSSATSPFMDGVIDAVHWQNPVCVSLTTSGTVQPSQHQCVFHEA